MKIQNIKHRWAKGGSVGHQFLSACNSEMVHVSRENSAGGIGREGEGCESRVTSRVALPGLP